MKHPTFDQAFWESLWTKTILQHAEKFAARAPNRYLVEVASRLAPGRALDMGCGTARAVERTRPIEGTGVDAVILARRKS